MKTLLRAKSLKLALVVVAGWAVAGCDVTVVGVGGDRFVEREKKEFQVSGTPDLTLATFDGAIEVRAWDRPDVSVEIEKRGPTKESTDRIKVTASQSGNRVTIEVKDPDEGRAHIGFGASRSARIIASVPRTCNVEATSGDGSVTIERIAGRVQLKTGDGSIKVVEVTGDVRLHTGDGTVALQRIEGRVDAETGDGSIIVDGKFDAVRLRTGDGTVRLRATTGSRVEEAWEIRTGDGSVGLELPDPFDADLDAHTNDGYVRLSDDLTVKGEVGKSAVRGQLGAGGRTLRVTTGDGSIMISRS